MRRRRRRNELDVLRFGRDCRARGTAVDTRRADGGEEQPVERQLPLLSKRIYRLLELSGYARLDFRLTPDGRLYFLEANPNPEIAKGEEFASAAQAAGMEYPELLERILALGLRGAE